MEVKLWPPFQYLLFSPVEWVSFRLHTNFTESIMPKSKTTKARKLPEWANEPLKFAFNPDEALRQGARAKPKQSWDKIITTGRKARR